MYTMHGTGTKAMTKKQQPTELGRLMYRWRTENEYTVEVAAERIDVVKSTWSNIENGVRKPEAETLLLLERELKVPFAELAKMAGFFPRESASIQHRAQRIAALAEGSPSLVGLLGHLEELRADQIDTLLSLAEDMDRQNKGLPRRQNTA